MKRSFSFLIIFFLCCLQQVSGSIYSLPQIYPVNFAGTEDLRKGDYEIALQKALADSSVSDTIYHYFKLACIHQKLNNAGKSTFLFKYVAQNCSSLAPIAYEHIAALEVDSGQKQNVLAAYSTVLKYEIPAKYRRYIFSKINQFAGSDTIELKKESWYDEYQQWLFFKQKPEKHSQENPYDSLLKNNLWKSIDTLIGLEQSGSGLDCKNATLIGSSELVDSLSAKSLYLLSQECFSCKNYQLALLLLKKAKSNPEFNKSPYVSKAMYLEAQILYDMENYSQALALFKKYEANYGTSADLILYMARGYRKLGREKDSYKWYSKLINKYPSHKKAHEALWLRAWQKEEDKNYSGAAQVYKQIYTRKSASPYKDESFLRHALTYYRLEKFDSAIVILENFKKVLPNSSLILAVDFWKAKCLFSLGKNEAAKSLFRQISSVEPYDYYAHRSRQQLSMLGENLSIMMDTSYCIQSALAWLDSITPVYPEKGFTRKDSLDYKTGVYLASVGRVDVAEFYLEPFENSFSGNLSLQFNISMLYAAADASTQSYRVARKLTWRIPQQTRGNIPLAVYSLLYPPFYQEAIKNNGAQFRVDPYLVSSVIRQESIFNPQILSPVGAVGLMQIMPYTGKYIANKLSEEFRVDSLSCPHFNIRYGVYYLRELLDQFNENVVLVLAGYNGGPHNASKWFQRNKDEEYDLFVEDILFSETRNYIKKVLGNYWTYLSLARNPGLKDTYIAY